MPSNTQPPIDRLKTQTPDVPPALWDAYATEHGPGEIARLAGQADYPRLLNAVYRLHQSGAGLPELLALLPEAAAARGGDYRAATADWQEAIGGDLRVVDLGLRLGGRRLWITLPPPWLTGLHGRLRVGEGGGRFGSQYDNWSTWSVRELLRLQTGSPEGDPPQRCGWGDRQGFHPSFTINGYDNQINHFALALRLFEVHRLPYAALVGPIPPQDPGGSADAEVTTAAYWFARGNGGRVAAHDVAVMQAVLRDGLAAHR